MDTKRKYIQPRTEILFEKYYLVSAYPNRHKPLEGRCYATLFDRFDFSVLCNTINNVNNNLIYETKQ